MSQEKINIIDIRVRTYVWYMYRTDILGYHNICSDGLTEKQIFWEILPVSSKKDGMDYRIIIYY